MRNPFTFSVQPGTGRIFINDVGQSTREEINDGFAGANYGWPTCEGVCNPPDPDFHDPFHTYANDAATCAITGGTFYNPPTHQFPAEYTGDYFFADFCGGWIRRIDTMTRSVTGFATNVNDPVDLQVGADGSLYYLARGDGAVYKVEYSASQAPSIIQHPVSQTEAEGEPVSFSVGASGSAPLSYQWQRDDVDISAATSAMYTLPSVSLADDGARFRVIVSNAFGSAISNPATLTVIESQPTIGSITRPAEGTLYKAGEIIPYLGTATDSEGVALPASAFTWKVDFHHDTHVHPFLPSTRGQKKGSFKIPTSGETATNVWYRVYLTVTDAQGIEHTTFRDIFPRIVTLTVATDPSGLQVTVDGQPHTTPHSFESVVGITRTLSTPTPQTLGDEYLFRRWSNGKQRTHNISTPAVAKTYTATFRR